MQPDKWIRPIEVPQSLPEAFIQELKPLSNTVPLEALNVCIETYVEHTLPNMPILSKYGTPKILVPATVEAEHVCCTVLHREHARIVDDHINHHQFGHKDRHHFKRPSSNCSGWGCLGLSDWLLEYRLSA